MDYNLLINLLVDPRGEHLRFFFRFLSLGSAATIVQILLLEQPLFVRPSRLDLFENFLSDDVGWPAVISFGHTDFEMALKLIGCLSRKLLIFIS